MKLVYFVLILILLNVEAQEIVKLVSDGLIQGTVLKSRLGIPFMAFLGIPYAESPEGKLRFQAPVPKKPWTGILNATIDGPICSQPSFLSNGNIQEDCLRLNVYTKDVNASKPVILYIHGGAFFLGSGLSSDAGPEILMDRDIVLVTINYRLGTLGFLGTGTRDAPGNAGFKDQVMAMRWVQQNIAAFGGNPKSVTLMGQSAGSISISLHIVSPMSKNLFHRAIMMSGAATAPWKIRHNITEFAQKQASLFNCSTNTTDEIIECLRNISPKELGSSLIHLDEFGRNPIMHFYPIIEQDFGQERFLLEDPNKSLKAGNYNKISFLSGITQDEIVQPAWEILEDDNLRELFDDNFNELAPITFLYERNTNRSNEIGATLRKEFLNFPLTKGIESLRGLNILFADSHISFPTHRFVQLCATHNDQPPIYYYKNTYVGRFSFFNYPSNEPYGVAHTDDLQYVLKLHRLGHEINADDPENIAVERITRMWTNFATTGDPNQKNDAFLSDLQWIPFNSSEQNYLNIGKQLVMEKNMYLERYAVWDKLFPVEREI